MNKIFKNILIFTTAIVALSSCREEVILDLNTVGAIPVIEANISNDSVPFVIKITTTADYYSLDIPIVNDAFVTISGSDGSLDTLIFIESTKCYQSIPGSPKFIHPCKVGVAYTLNVTYKGKTYSATETCLPQNPIDSLKTIYLPKRGFFPAGYYLYEWTREKPGKGDCYLWNLYQNDTMLTKDFYYLADDQFLEEGGQYLSTDFQFPFRLNDSIKLEQIAISRQFYNFLTAIQSQTGRDGSPFSAPPSIIGGNISIGGLGYFAVRNIIRKKLVAK
jgi:hypothetical protein